MDAPTTWVPVDSCTLPTAEQPFRVAEFDDLFATSLRAVERTAANHARLLLDGDQNLTERVQALADAETACCSFFTFTLTPQQSGGALALDIEVPAARSDVLAALVQRAENAAA